MSTDENAGNNRDLIAAGAELARLRDAEDTEGLAAWALMHGDFLCLLGMRKIQADRDAHKLKRITDIIFEA